MYHDRPDPSSAGQNYTGGAATTQATKELGIPSQIGRLGIEIHELEKIICLLSERLTPVLRTEEKGSAVGSDAERTPQSMIENDLFMMRNATRSCKISIAQLIARLEI